MDERPLLTARQVGERLSVGVRTVWRLVQRGELPAPQLRLNRKVVRWTAESVDAYLARFPAPAIAAALPDPGLPKDLVTFSAAARRLGQAVVTAAAIRRWAAAGLLPRWRVGDRAYVSWADVLALVQLEPAAAPQEPAPGPCSRRDRAAARAGL